MGLNNKNSNIPKDLAIKENKLKLKGNNNVLIGDGVEIQNKEIQIDDENIDRSIEVDVDENIVKQTYLGGYIEVQPDSWDGEITSTDNVSKIWGFPFSLDKMARKKIKDEVFNGKNIMYIRFPLGFAYRGFRNIDDKTNLAKNIGERFSGQNETLKNWFSEITKYGGGLAPEYWCPAPYWLTSGSYSGNNQLRAGGNYSVQTTLASIKNSDETQYNAQINDFTDAIINDLEYLHQNIAPVRMFSLQNEPQYPQMKYGACKYDAQTYNDVLEVLYPKILASKILSEYEYEKNEIKLLVASSDEDAPFEGIAKTFIDNHSDMIWGYTHHMMRKVNGEKYLDGADWYKSDDFTSTKGLKKNVILNEYEYFSNTYGSNDFRCSNNMLHLINELVYGEAQILHPIIHICKPLGQTLSSTNTKGYSLYEANLNGEYGIDINSELNIHKIPKGMVYPNKTMYNAWAMFGENLPIGAYLVGDYTQQISRCGWCIYRYENKLYLFLANNYYADAKITLNFKDYKSFEGKFYNLSNCGSPIQKKEGYSIDFVIPAYSGQFWLETTKTPSYSYGTIDLFGSLISKERNYTDDRFIEISTNSITITAPIEVEKINIIEYDENKKIILKNEGTKTSCTEETFRLNSRTKYIRVNFVILFSYAQNIDELFENYKIK